MNHKIQFPVLLTFLLTLGIAADFSFWAGPNHDYIYPETDLLDNWPENGPELIWKAEGIGSGYASAAIAGDLVYISGMIDDMGSISAFSMNGELVWRTEYGPEWHRNFPGARSTVTAYKGLLYILSGQGKLICLEAEKGDIQWDVDLFSKYGGRNLQFGISESILIDGDRIFCTPGGEEHNVLALNRLSGELIWSSPGNGETSAYCSPRIVEIADRRIVTTATGGSLIGLDYDTGEVVWNTLLQRRFDCFPNTPLYHDGFIFVCAGYRFGGAMLEMAPDGSDVKEIWRNETMDNQMGGVVLMNGHLYGSGHQRDEGWQCINWNTGEVLYSDETLGRGSVIFADGLFYIYSETGDMSLVKASPDTFEVISSFEITEGTQEHFSHPVIDDGRLYVRHGDVLLVYNIRG